jgi:hypothetical protein
MVTMTMSLIQHQNLLVKVSESFFFLQKRNILNSKIGLPQRTPSKKHDDEKESVTSLKREREPSSPLLKKAGVTVHPRRMFM